LAPVIRRGAFRYQPQSGRDDPPNFASGLCELHTLSAREWDLLYRTAWREPFAHLSKPERGKLVQGCRGKSVFDSFEEAHAMLRTFQPTGKLRQGAYQCPLCHKLHVADRRVLAFYRRYAMSEAADPKAIGLASL
jgi:hypothetical protein